ncbi:hypothetical protein B8W95_13820, partial [Staphylococcus pasteuri]
MSRGGREDDGAGRAHEFLVLLGAKVHRNSGLGAGAAAHSRGCSAHAALLLRLRAHGDPAGVACCRSGG